MTDRSLETPLHPSLVRPILLGGAERDLVLLNALAVAVLVLGVGPHVLTLLLGGLLATVGQAALVLAARHDAQMWRVYSRHIRYQTYYPARALLGAPLATVHPFPEKSQ